MTDRWQDEEQQWLDGDRRLDAEIVDDAELAEAAYAALEMVEAMRDATVERPARSRVQRLTWAVGLAAAVLAVVVLMPRERGVDDDFRLRGSGEAAATALAPEGDLTSFPRTFRWTGNPDARWRWELYDAEARRRAVAVVADTMLVRAPADTPTDSLGSWRWLVVELMADGSEGPTSQALSFTVAEDAR